jgi:hypothetical protein
MIGAAKIMFGGGTKVQSAWWHFNSHMKLI